MTSVPYISRESVTRHLDALLYDSDQQPVIDLEGLLIVDVVVSELPHGELSREFAVRELLTDMILKAYRDICAALELVMPSLNVPQSAVEKRIQADAAPRNPELLAWSLLYHRYIRTDLSLDVNQLAGLISAGNRTFRRYQAYAIRMLTYGLIRAEVQARLLKKQRYLYTMLPSSVPMRLIGRDGLIEATSALIDTITPAHLVITGISGVGKTSFAQALMRRWIDEGRLDELVWINAPSSNRAVFDQLTEHLLPEGGQISLSEQLLCCRVGIVLDGVKSLDFESLMPALNAALVVLINDEHVVVDGANITVRELTLGDSEALVRELFRKQHHDDAEDSHEIARHCYERFGGNPAAIKTIISQWAFAELEQVESQLAQNLFGRVFELLPVGSRVVWCALAAASRLSVLPTLFDADDISALMRHHIVERQDQHYRLGLHGADEYIYSVSTPLISTALAELIERISTFEPHALTALYPIAEAILTGGFPALTLDQRAAWCQQFCAEGVARGQHGCWRTILENYVLDGGVLNADLRTNYGVILRRLGDWQGAQAVFYDVTAELGRTGNFHQQAIVLLEWSITAKYQGDFKQALTLLAQAKRLPQKDADLRYKLTVQEAQILVESGKARNALHLLEGVGETPRLMILKSEAYLSLRDFSASRRYAESALQAATHDLVTQASLFTVIGRTYEGEGQFKDAEHYFIRVVSLLEQADAPYTLARAQSNLAALLIKRKGYSDARQLLNDAEVTQVRLGDKVGLMTTRHNRTILHNAIHA